MVAPRPMLGALIALKKYPTPILKPLWPFFVGAGLTYYGIGLAADAMMDTDEYKNDPRNPKYGKH
ncbi:RNA polymerase II subunit A C-terminal domain phosphatase [Lipomyces oligophaga]|uniref:RNA polymerase II subunit A C-terminal domain phosphatase n=1 Tax=Lipomyces oligophaga TaxID=45792 RepID=UPI0034CDF877